MNSVNQIRYNYKLSTRNYTITKEKHFKIPSIGLIQSFKISNYEDFVNKYSSINPVITIGNFQIEPNSLYANEDKSIISIKQLRNYIRNIDFPETEFDNKLINFEHFLFSQQLKCTEHYYTIKNNDLYDSIFTSELNIYIELYSNGEALTDDLVIEETYWDKVYNEDNKNKNN
jgi:hypothetical protein